MTKESFKKHLSGDMVWIMNCLGEYPAGLTPTEIGMKCRNNPKSRGSASGWASEHLKGLVRLGFVKVDKDKRYSLVKG